MHQHIFLTIGRTKETYSGVTSTNQGWLKYSACVPASSYRPYSASTTDLIKKPPAIAYFSPNFSTIRPTQSSFIYKLLELLGQSVADTINSSTVSFTGYIFSH